MNYIDIINSDFYNSCYTQIEELKKDFPVNHGFKHIDNVIKNAKYLARIFELSEKETNLLLIACTLHDIGYLNGRKEHAYNGSILAKQYLQKIDMQEEDVNVICNAIANHGAKDESCFLNSVSMCLALADKLDFAQDRYKKDISTYPQIAPYLNILKTELQKDGNKIVLVVSVNKQFSVESLNDDYFNVKLTNLLKLLHKTRNYECSLEYKQL